MAQQLETDVKNGALGLGEIMKGFGLRATKADGSRLHIDDPELDPIWDAAARLNIAVLIHTADPQEFFQPINYTNERWQELALYPDVAIRSRNIPRSRRSTLSATTCSASTRRRSSSWRTSGGTRTTWRESPRCSTRCRTSTVKLEPCSTTSGVSPGRRTTFW
jgi:hypothetical protein